MAKYIGLISSDMRGKVGGVVASRGRSGTTLKAKHIPVGLTSQGQNNQRQRLSASLYAWRALNDTEHLSWGSIAFNLTWTNSLAQTYTPTGLQLWQQAFVNAHFYGTVPPGTCGGSPGAIPVITTVGLSTSPLNLTSAAYNTGGAYTGNWILYVSGPLSPSVNYVKTVAKIFVRAYTGGSSGNFYNAYANRYGPPPAANTPVAYRAVPVDPTYFYSGTPITAASSWV